MLYEAFNTWSKIFYFVLSNNSQVVNIWPSAGDFIQISVDHTAADSHISNPQGLPALNMIVEAAVSG